MEEITYIECCCKSFDHALRVHYETDPLTLFSLEYRTLRLPQTWQAPYKSKNKLARLISRVFDYLRNIWYAIKGRPLSYIVYTELDPDEAYKLATFIQKKLNKMAQ